MALSFALAAFSAAPAIADNPRQNDFNVLDRSDTARYSAAFDAIHGGRWAEAKARISDLPRGELRAMATAELYLAKDSPIVEAADLEALLNEAPWLPQGKQLGRLAAKRGVTSIPAMPDEQRFSWLGSSPHRGDPDRVRDPAADALRDRINERIVADDPAGAEMILRDGESGLGRDALTEMQKRVAWSYYIENDDRSARRMASMAMAGSGEWAAHGQWVYALASWRLSDYPAARENFAAVAGRAREPELKAAGLYWSGRAAMAAGQPQLVQPAFQAATREKETFYGLLAAEALGMEPLVRRDQAYDDNHGDSLLRDRQIRLVATLGEIGETALADETLKFFARTGSPADHAKYIAAARALGLPQAQLWLAHNGPSGARLDSFARYPAPNWNPDGGWRIDRALVYAHALQESRFRSDAESPAGARGLLQVMPATARHLARLRGSDISSDDLYRPDINLELGQSYMELMRDTDETRGLLPKVIAAYNAGPTPVGRWAMEVNDQGDPLLFIESIPYWETRGYVGTVMRNFWMYEAQEKASSDSREGIAQNMWPRYPGLSGPKSVRLADPQARDRVANR